MLLDQILFNIALVAALLGLYVSLQTVSQDRKIPVKVFLGHTLPLAVAPRTTRVRY
jgi:hypothetical protein